MSRSLPERPNLDHLKNEAKALLKTLRATDPNARWVGTHALRELTSASVKRRAAKKG